METNEIICTKAKSMVIPDRIKILGDYVTMAVNIVPTTIKYDDESFDGFEFDYILCPKELLTNILSEHKGGGAICL